MSARRLDFLFFYFLFFCLKAKRNENASWPVHVWHNYSQNFTCMIQLVVLSMSMQNNPIFAFLFRIAALRTGTAVFGWLFTNEEQERVGINNIIIINK